MTRPNFSSFGMTPSRLSPFQTLNASLQRSLVCRRQFTIQDESGRLAGVNPGISRPKNDPLRILFCGSDDFSCASLKALHDEHKRNPELVESIDVVVRPGKAMGRGNKEIRHPPIRGMATTLGLPIHERDTFTGWNMPESINLIVAVSFGLFVPPRLLRTAKYGGLNVHPSLLPEFRGPAPLHHTILNYCKFTGVTLQTLDEKTFDAGTVLAQTRMAGLIQIPPRCTVKELQDIMSPPAASILVQGLRDELYIPPHQDRGWATGYGESKERFTEWKVPHMVYKYDSHLSSEEPKPRTVIFRASSAPKIQARDRQLILNPSFGYLNPQPSDRLLGMSSYRVEGLDVRRRIESFEVRQRAIGPLWFMAKDKEGDLKRVIIEEADMEPTPSSHVFDFETGRFCAYKFSAYGEDMEGEKYGYEITYGYKDGDESMYLIEDNRGSYPHDTRLKFRRILRLKVEGERAKPAKQAFQQFKSRLMSDAPEATRIKELLTEQHKKYQLQREYRRRLSLGLNPRYSCLGRRPDGPPRREPPGFLLRSYSVNGLNIDWKSFAKWLLKRQRAMRDFATLIDVEHCGKGRKLIWKRCDATDELVTEAEDHEYATVAASVGSGTFEEFVRTPMSVYERKGGYVHLSTKYPWEKSARPQDMSRMKCYRPV